MGSCNDVLPELYTLIAMTTFPSAHAYDTGYNVLQHILITTFIRTANGCWPQLSASLIALQVTMLRINYKLAWEKTWHNSI